MLKALKTPSDIVANTTAEGAAVIRREAKILSDHEISELDTGKRLVTVRNIFEQSGGGFAAFLQTMPFTPRTGYRRLKTYERAMEIWPEEVVNAAIERRLQVVGWQPDKPMGLYEDIEAPRKNLTPAKIEEYLTQAELEVRRLATRSVKQVLPPFELLKNSFRAIEKNARDLPEKERESFLHDLVGLSMTLFGAQAQKFLPQPIPVEFWSPSLGGYSRSAETRAKVSETTKARWARIRRSKEESA